MRAGRATPRAGRYMRDRHASPDSTISRASGVQPDPESFHTASEHRDHTQPDLTDGASMYQGERSNPLYGLGTLPSRQTTENPQFPIYMPPGYTPQRYMLPGYKPPPSRQAASPSPNFLPPKTPPNDDWITRRAAPQRLGAADFSPNWLMNTLPQIKIEEELRKRYGQPQVVARSHLMALMNIPAIRDDDANALAILNRTLHGAMHALRTGGYEQDLESGMTLEHVVSSALANAK